MPIRPWPLFGCLLAIAATIAVQDLLRPALQGTPWLTLLGTAPSFLYALAGVLGVASIASWPSSWRWWAVPGPFGYELLQPWIAGRTFDPWDLLASLAGALLAVFLTRTSAQQPAKLAAVSKRRSRS